MVIFLVILLDYISPLALLPSLALFKFFSRSYIPPRSGFFEEIWWQPSSHSCPIPKSRHLTDSIFKIFLTTLSFSLFLNQLQCKFLFYFIAWNYYNNLCPLFVPKQLNACIIPWHQVHCLIFLCCQ